MGYFIGLPLGLFFGALIYGMWSACDVEGEYKQPPYDWNQADPDLWLIEPVLFTKQSRED
jgi:hypothetical protein